MPGRLKRGLGYAGKGRSTRERIGLKLEVSTGQDENQGAVRQGATARTSLGEVPARLLGLLGTLSVKAMCQ